MFDASGKVPDGLAAGNTFVLGSYEACVKVSYSLQQQITFSDNFSMSDN